MENATKPDNMEVKVPELAQEAVMVKSIPVEKGTPIVKGFDFNTGRDLDSIMAAAMTTGFQVREIFNPAFRLLQREASTLTGVLGINKSTVQAVISCSQPTRSRVVQIVPQLP